MLMNNGDDKLNGGLTPEELEISKHIVAAWNGFVKLKQTHPSDINEFHQAVHTLQKTMGMRILRRDYPDYWLDKAKRDEEK
jgi:hypothetical protein